MYGHRLANGCVVVVSFDRDWGMDGPTTMGAHSNEPMGIRFEICARSESRRSASSFTFIPSRSYDEAVIQCALRPRHPVPLGLVIHV